VTVWLTCSQSSVCSSPLTACSSPLWLIFSQLSVCSFECAFKTGGVAASSQSGQLRHKVAASSLFIASPPCVALGNSSGAATLNHISRLQHHNSIASSPTEYKSLSFTIRKTCCRLPHMVNRIQNILGVWIQLAASGNLSPLIIGGVL